MFFKCVSFYNKLFYKLLWKIRFQSYNFRLIFFPSLSVWELVCLSVSFHYFLHFSLHFRSANHVVNNPPCSPNITGKIKRIHLMCTFPLRWTSQLFCYISSGEKKDAVQTMTQIIEFWCFVICSVSDGFYTSAVLNHSIWFYILAPKPAENDGV